MLTVVLPLLLAVLFAMVQTSANPAELVGQPAPSNVLGQQYPRIHADLSVTFRVEAPKAHEVSVQPLDNEFGTRPYPMVRQANGAWMVTTPPVVPGFHYYELIIDGVHCTDPCSETYFGYARQTSGLEVPDPNLSFYDAKDVPHGQVRAVWYHSAVTGQMRRAYVYTPYGYDRSRARYPVLYLQHGSGESERGWSTQGRANFILDNLIAEKKATPMLVVMDNGYANAIGQTVQQSQNAFGRVVIEDLVPFIDHEFRTLADPDHRALAGLSMGGGQAFSIGTQNLKTFHSIGVFSGAVRNFDLAKSPLADVGATNRTIKLFWIGCGTDDSLLPSNEALHKAFDLAGIRHRWFTGPGGHVWQVWRKHFHEFASLVFQPQPTVRAVDLRCEYLTHPVGLDVPTPRFSWRMELADLDRRGSRQTAYRILVAASPDLLAQDHGDLWDSGLVKSDRSVQIEYAGNTLSSNQACWWKVQIVDERGRTTPWSAPARWTMGLLHPSDWKAEWIGTAATFGHIPKQPNNITHENTVTDPWLRKEFDLAATPDRAVMYVASVGYHELYVNGKRAGDEVLAPSVTDNGKRARYVTYDIAHLLHPGKNAVVLWLGVSWSIFPHFAPPSVSNRPATPIALGQAEIWLPNGVRQTVVTDGTWRTHPSPNKLLGVWDFMNFGGEEYDARNEVPGWSLPGLDDSSWDHATVYQPNLVVSSDNLEPNRPVREIYADSVKAMPDGSYRVDMGVNFSGWIEFPVHGKPGDRIDFEFSERENVAETHKLHSAYILGPKGWGVFKNRFNYGVGRWITIKGLNSAPDRGQIRGWLVRSDYERAAQFTCSNPLLNKIYDMTLWTFENLSLGGYVVDCPQRERMGYGGDAHATTQAALTNYRMGAFYSKWARDWRDSQAADGGLPYTAPTYWGGGGPVWMGFSIFLPWEMYRQYGDVRILHEQYPTMKRWLAFMESHAKDDLLVRWGGDWDFLGDWLWPGANSVNGDTAETLCFNNCYWVYALRLASRIGTILGDADAGKFAKRADRVASAINARFVQAGRHEYGNGDQMDLAAALLGMVPDPSDLPKVWKRLEDEILVHRKGHIYAGIIGGSLLSLTLAEANRSDLMATLMSQNDYPGWGDFIEKGHTTFPEEWNGGGSQLHSSFLFVGAWFIEGLAGITQAPNAAGFQHFELRPLVDANPRLDHAAATFDSPYGRIACAWYHDAGQTTLTVTVPPNSTATLVVPTAHPDQILESGKPLKTANGVSKLRSDPGKATMLLQSGTYRLRF
jgi:alpha-L-rhamnosidase